MKLLVAICVLALIALSSASPRERRQSPCTGGRCRKQCEAGTHLYVIGCAQRTPEPTCEEPNPKKERAIICDYTGCYCDPPTVRDRVSGQCVPLDQCPKND